MFRMNIKGIFILSLSWCILNTSAYCSIRNKEALTEKCLYLSQNVSLLMMSQKKKTCIEKLSQAVLHIDQAADAITEERYKTAKKELTEAVYFLQFAELNNCNQYIRISHAKFEAQNIKNNILI